MVDEMGSFLRGDTLLKVLEEARRKSTAPPTDQQVEVTEEIAGRFVTKKIPFIDEEYQAIMAGQEALDKLINPPQDEGDVPAVVNELFTDSDFFPRQVLDTPFNNRPTLEIRPRAISGIFRTGYKAAEIITRNPNLGEKVRDRLQQLSALRGQMLDHSQPRGSS